MKTTTSKKQNICNPQKWIGKYVRHMANWMEFQWGDNGYVVCEWTGTLLKIEDAQNAYYGDTFGTIEEAEAAGYDDCYYYSERGLHQMWQRANLEKPMSDKQARAYLKAWSAQQDKIKLMMTDLLKR